MIYYKKGIEAKRLILVRSYTDACDPTCERERFYYELCFDDGRTIHGAVLSRGLIHAGWIALTRHTLSKNIISLIAINLPNGLSYCPPGDTFGDCVCSAPGTMLLLYIKDVGKLRLWDERAEINKSVLRRVISAPAADRDGGLRKKLRKIFSIILHNTNDLPNTWRGW